MEFQRRPVTVGEVLLEEFLKPMSVSQKRVAESMGVAPRIVSELCRNRRTITADTALMLSRVFGNAAEFWLNLQRRNDRWQAQHAH
ncbi:Antitoxin HigA-1 [compost metagenome]